MVGIPKSVRGSVARAARSDAPAVKAENMIVSIAQVDNDILLVRLPFLG